MLTDKILVCYVDGSTKPNPGYSGFGLFGYTLLPSKRPNKTKHPTKPKLYFTSKGVSETPDNDPYETVDIVEHMGAIEDPLGTNNLAEIYGLHKALLLSDELNVSSLVLYTDSKYVVSGFTEYLDKWVSRNWIKQNGDRVSHELLWKELLGLREKLKEKGTTLSINWVKGHADDYGNGRAHIYAGIGSNWARMQHEDKHPTFDPVAFHSITSYKDFKDELATKDILLYFRELFFTSSSIQDSDFCFVSTSDDVNEQGRRDSASIFITNVGYVPDEINQIKALYRRYPRYHVASCYAKLSKLEDRELARLSRRVGIEKLIRPVYTEGVVNLHLIEDSSPFIGQYTKDFPYVVEVSRVFGNTLAATEVTPITSIRKFDVTDLFVKDGKIAFTNKDKHLDVGDRFVASQDATDGWMSGVTPVSKLLLAVGKDVPNYLALKKLESEITSVGVIVELRAGNAYGTVYLVIQTENRTILTVNITNKYLFNRV